MDRTPHKLSDYITSPKPMKNPQNTIVEKKIILTINQK
jgi:hypothetical protein